MLDVGMLLFVRRHPVVLLPAGLVLMACQVAGRAPTWPLTAGQGSASLPAPSSAPAPRSDVFRYQASYMGLAVGSGTYTVEQVSNQRRLLRATLTTSAALDLIAPLHATQETLVEAAATTGIPPSRFPLRPLRFVWLKKGSTCLEPPAVSIDGPAGMATLRRVTQDGIRLFFLTIDDPVDLLSLVESLRIGILPVHRVESREFLTPTGKMYVRVRDEGREAVDLPGRSYDNCRRISIDTLDRAPGTAGVNPRVLGHYTVWVAPAPQQALVRALRSGPWGDLLIELVATECREPLPRTSIGPPLALLLMAGRGRPHDPAMH